MIGRNLPFKHERVKIEQDISGITVPASGLLPMYFNNNSGTFQPAASSSTQMAADTVAVNASNGRITLQENGVLNCRDHGLDVGCWYVLGESGGIVRADLFSGSRWQFICFVPSDDSIIVSVEPMFVLDEDVLQDVAFDSTSWTAGSTIVPAGVANTNRILVVWFALESGSAATQLINMSLGGQTGTIQASDFITSGFTNRLYCVTFTDSQLQAATNNTLTATISNAGSFSDASIASATYSRVDQLAPITETASDTIVGNGSFNAVINVNAGSASLFAWTSGNPTSSVTNNTVPSTFGVNFNGPSSASSCYFNLEPAIASRNANFSIVGNNRAILINLRLNRETV